MGLLVDIVDRAEIDDGPDGKRVVRLATVTELTGSTPHGMLQDALETVGVPAKGAAHPDARLATLTVQRLTARATSFKAAEIEIVYGRPAQTGGLGNTTDDDGPAIKQISSTLITTTLSVDRADNPMIVSAPAGEEFIFDQDKGQGRGAQLVLAQVTRPITTLRFERLEATSNAARARDFMNKVNSTTETPYATNSLKVTNIESITEDGGDSYRATYVILHDPLLHRFPGQWIDRVTGKPPPVNDANSQKLFDVLDEINFAGLSLDFSD